MPEETPAPRHEPGLEDICAAGDVFVVAPDDDIDFDIGCDVPPVRVHLKRSPSAPEGVHSIGRLVADKRPGRDMEHFKRIVIALPGLDTRTLIVKIATAADPLVLWCIHLALDKRGISPCLRWPANRDTPQAEFITYLADLFWFAKRNSGHQPKFKGWQRLFLNVPGTTGWNDGAYWQFAILHRSGSIAMQGSKGLALTSLQRQDLMLFPTTTMTARRRGLQPSRFEDTRAALLTHAVENPDKSGRHSPELISRRRALLWRVHVLTGGGYAATAKNWNLLTNEHLTRQAVSKQIDIIENVLRLHREQHEVDDEND